MKTKTLTSPPIDFTEHPDHICSNFDGIINRKVKKAIKGKKEFSEYPGYNFFGIVWWEDDMWHCKVMIFHIHVDTISEKTMEELRESVCDEYGYE